MQGDMESVDQPPQSSPTKSSSGRDGQIFDLLKGPIIELERLRKLSWTGIPIKFRAHIWKILLGYIPNVVDRQQNTLNRKREEYRDLVEQHFGSDARRDEAIMRQITLDVPRTAPETPLFRNDIVREALTRILYCWSIRRPASGYVQGINDLATPLYNVFIEDVVNSENPSAMEAITTLENAQGRRIIEMPLGQMQEVEADTFWCLGLLLDTIQDNYTHQQSGIRHQLAKLRELLLRTDPVLLNHLEAEGLTITHIAFRWINCLLIREFPLPMVIRLWDTYLAEGEQGFRSFHVYVCAAFLTRWSPQLQLLEFQELVLFLQNPPTTFFTEHDLEMLLSEAFMWKTVFEASLENLSAQ